MKSKNHWIRETMESLDHINQAEANPYLYIKTMARMQKNDLSVAVFSKGMIWKLSVGFAILLILNLAAIKKYRSQQPGDLSNNSASVNEYSFQFNYNY